MADDGKNPFEEMAEAFFGQAAEYIKATMDEIKGGDGAGKGDPPPPPAKVDLPKTDQPAKKKHSWFGEVE